MLKNCFRSPKFVVIVALRLNKSSSFMSVATICLLKTNEGLSLNVVLSGYNKLYISVPL